jgi:hypothetical protein
MDNITEKILAFQNSQDGAGHTLQYEDFYRTSLDGKMAYYLVSDTITGTIHNQQIVNSINMIKEIRAKNDFIIKTPFEIFKSQNGVLNLIDKVFVSLPIKNIKEKIVWTAIRSENCDPFINILSKYDNTQLRIIGTETIDISYYNMLMENYGIYGLRHIY